MDATTDPNNRKFSIELPRILSKIWKKETIVLLLILLVAFGIRYIPFHDKEFYGYDLFFHASVIEQAVNSNGLPISNSLDICPYGIKVNEPLGLYIIPFIPAHIISAKSAMGLTSAIFGVLTILLIFFLLRKVSNSKIALIGSAFLAVCFAHIWKSNMAYYRGENIIFPFLLLSLIFGLKFLTDEGISSKKRIIYSAIAGLASGITAFFWLGFLSAVIIYILSVIIFILYSFFTSNENLNKNIEHSLLSIAVQATIIAAVIITIYTTAFEHYLNQYLFYILTPVVLFLVTLRILNKFAKDWKRKLGLFGAMVAVISAVALIKRDIVSTFMTGFGYITPTNRLNSMITELQPITFSAIYSMLWIPFIIAIIGLVALLYKLDKKRAFFLGWALPGIFFLTTTLRFIFFISILLIPIAGFAFEPLIKRINKKVVIVIALVLLVASGIYTVKLISTLQPIATPDIINSLNYFGKNSEPNSCLITLFDWGGMTEYYAKRASYMSSTNQDLSRTHELNNFLFSNESFGFSDVPHAYVAMMPNDFNKIQALLYISNMTGPYADHMGLTNKATYNDRTESYYTSINSNKYTITITTNNTITASRLEGNKQVYIKHIFFEYNNTVFNLQNEQAEDNGCIYISNYMTAYFNNELCSSNIIKMLTEQKISGLSLWYAQSDLRIYKAINSTAT